MNKGQFLPPLFFIFTVIVFFYPFIVQGKLPIPSDTIIGLYHPYRDLYAQEYPNGIPFKNYLITDPVRQQYPWRLLAIDEEKKGKLPIWNPYSLSGTPLLANFQSGAFYPFNILFFVLPFFFSWSLLVFLEPLLSGIFMYFYLKYFRLSSWAAFLGAFIYSFSGFSIAWMEWNTMIQIALWLPLILLAKEKLLQKISWMWSLILLFSEISTFFAGHLQILFYSLCISNIYLIFRIFQITFKENKKENFLLSFLKKYFPFLLIGVIVLGVTAIVWIPSLHFILQSGRDIDQLNNWQKEGWFIPWQNLIQFLIPDFFGNPVTLNYWGVWNYGEFIGYIGIFPLLLAIFALFYRRDKKTLFFGSLFFLSLIFALPTFFAKIPYMLHIPFFQSAQPTRLLFITDFSLSILAALGFDRYIKSESKQKELLGPLLFFILSILLIWIFVVIGYKGISSISLEHSLIAKHNLYFPTVIFTSILLLMMIRFFKKTKNIQSIVFCLLLILSIFDLFRFAQKFTPFTERSYLFPQTALLSFLQQDHGIFRIMTTDNRILTPNFSVVYHLQTLDGYDPLYLQRYGEFIAAMERGKPDIASPFGFNRIIVPHNIDSQLADLLGVKYVLSFSDFSNPKLHLIAQEGQTKLYENDAVFQRAFFVTKIIPTLSKQETIDKMFDRTVNLKNMAIVENWQKGKLSFAKGSVSVIEYTPSAIILRTQVPGDGFLVFMDTYYPTWHASICTGVICQETPIYQANYVFRGLEIPKGEHIIRITNTL